jgi:hypothetical protein
MKNQIHMGNSMSNNDAVRTIKRFFNETRVTAVFLDQSFQINGLDAVFHTHIAHDFRPGDRVKLIIEKIHNDPKSAD